MQLSILFPVEDLLKELNEGYVTGRPHPYLPYTIYNYTRRAVVNDYWNEVILSCRGLVVDNDNEVVARPFKKFFNGSLNFNNLSGWELDDPIEVTEQIDGSLGILYPDPRQPTGYAVATRGSFTSLQAEHATELYQQTYQNFKPSPALTYLFEIVYPENRIVVDYGQDDCLYLLGAVKIETGEILSARHFDCPRTQIYPFRKFQEFVENFRPKTQRKGFVIRNLRTGEMLKYKHEEYVALHRLLFSLNATVVWEVLVEASKKAANGETWEWDDFISRYPDDIRRWIVSVRDYLLAQYVKIHLETTTLYQSIVEGKPRDRKEFALEAVKHKHAKYLFLLYDNRSIAEAIWKDLKPSGDWKPGKSE